MKDISKAQQSAEQKIQEAHNYLQKFLGDYGKAKRGGIHDFIELTMANMIQQSIVNIDTYLSAGHKTVNASELMAITADAFQSVIDGVKRNLEVNSKVSLQ